VKESIIVNYVQNFIQHLAVKEHCMQRKLLGIISEDFDSRGKLLIIYSALVKYLRKNWTTVKLCIGCL
jgi:hypothetical protein